MKRVLRDVILLVLLVLVAAAPAFAQKVTITSEGVAGDMDAQRRNPVLSVSRVVSDGGVTLLVDAYVPNSEYTKYPIKFEFYIDRRLVLTQIRSEELPGPIGIDIGSDTAPIPFNYAVIARVIHPNRTFSTMITGAAFSQDLIGVFDCTLTLGEEGETTVFVANDVTTTQAGNDSFAFAAEGESSDGGEKATASGVVATSGDTASATLQITRSDTVRLANTSGTVTVVNSRIVAFQLSSEDGTTQLSCS